MRCQVCVHDTHNGGWRWTRVLTRRTLVQSPYYACCHTCFHARCCTFHRPWHHVWYRRWHCSRQRPRSRPRPSACAWTYHNIFHDCGAFSSMIEVPVITSHFILTPISAMHVWQQRELDFLQHGTCIKYFRWIVVLFCSWHTWVGFLAWCRFTFGRFHTLRMSAFRISILYKENSTSVYLHYAFMSTARTHCIDLILKQQVPSSGAALVRSQKAADVFFGPGRAKSADLLTSSDSESLEQQGM